MSPDGSGGRLQSAVLEALHLEVEAPSEAALLSDQVIGGNGPTVEGKLVGVHAAVSDGVDGAALEPPAAGLGEDEAVTVSPVFRYHEHRQPAMGPAPVRVGAGEHHQNVGAGGEGRPRLGAVDLPVPPFAARVAATVIPATSEPKSGSVTETPAMISPLASFGSHLRLLILRAAAQQGPGQDLRSGDQGTAGAERGSRQLLGRHHHAQVVVLPARRVAAVLLGDGQPERAQLAEAGDDFLRDVVVAAVDRLRRRGDLVLGKATEGVGDHLEIGVQMAGARLPCQCRQPAGVAVGGHEGRRPREGARPRRPTTASRPSSRLATSHTASAAKAAASAASSGPRVAVVEGGPGRLDGGGRVSQVVGHRLVLVDRPGPLCRPGGRRPGR